jgi:hypothetical protein
MLVSYVTNPNPTQVQIWDSVFHDNGNGTPYHGLYFGAADATCLVANCVFYDNYGFAAQFGPNSDNLIITCCTSHENKAGGYGGYSIWTQGAYTNINNRIVGCIASTGGQYREREPELRQRPGPRPADWGGLSRRRPRRPSPVCLHPGD